MLILPEDKSIISLLNPDESKLLLLAIFTDEGEEVDLSVMSDLTKMAYFVIRDKSERISSKYVNFLNKQSKNGGKGGAPSGNQNAKKQPETTQNNPSQPKQPKSTQNNPKQPKTTETTQNKPTVPYQTEPYRTEPNQTDTKKTKGIKTPPTQTLPVRVVERVRVETPKKIQYAEFVSMTNDEYSSLVAKVGEAGALRCIEILDNYKGSSGKKYKSDYRTMFTWVIKRYYEETTPTPIATATRMQAPNANPKASASFLDLLDENGKLREEYT